MLDQGLIWPHQAPSAAATPLPSAATEASGSARHRGLPGPGTLFWQCSNLLPAACRDREYDVGPSRADEEDRWSRRAPAEALPERERESKFGGPSSSGAADSADRWRCPWPCSGGPGSCGSPPAVAWGGQRGASLELLAACSAGLSIMPVLSAWLCCSRGWQACPLTVLLVAGFMPDSMPPPFPPTWPK